MSVWVKITLIEDQVISEEGNKLQRDITPLFGVPKIHGF